MYKKIDLGEGRYLELAQISTCMLCGIGGSNLGSKKKYHVNPYKQVLLNTAAKLNFMHYRLKVMLNS